MTIARQASSRFRIKDNYRLDLALKLPAEEEATLMQHPQALTPGNLQHRNCGRLFGILNPILPFLWVGGMPTPDRENGSNRMQGVFRISNTYEHGLVLPIHACLNTRIRERLLDLALLLGGTQTLGCRRYVERTLSEAFAGAVQLDCEAGLDDDLRLEFDDQAFRILRDGFHYLTLAQDGADQPIVPMAIAPFTWETPWDLIRWAGPIEHRGKKELEWPSMKFIWKHPSSEPNGSAYSHQRHGLRNPGMRFPDYFTVKESSEILPLEIRFEMRGCGWAYLHLKLGDQSNTVSLSNVYDPFPTIESWLGAVAREEYSVQMEIDEEGRTKGMAMHATSSPITALFVLDLIYGPEVYLQGLVNPQQVVKAFQDALRTFFDGEFIPESWDMSCQRKSGIPWGLELETKMREDPILQLHPLPAS